MNKFNLQKEVRREMEGGVWGGAGTHQIYWEQNCYKGTQEQKVLKMKLSSRKLQL